jgi:hypothetical protein
MSDKPTTDVLGALPRTRPHRRSGKRAARPGEAPQTDADAATEREPAAGTPRSNGDAGKPKRRAARSGAAKSARGRKQATPTAGAKPARGGRGPRSGAPKPGRPAGGPPSEPPRERPRAVSGPGKAARLPQPPQPAGTPAGPRPRKPAPASSTEILGTAVQAAAELAEIGLTVSARALRNAVSRLPKP